ncbi:MAG TPA: sodium/proton-translocating pyrophosphatase [Polyangiaceae bacterium]|nr:sodium/proton-translocating pyrophosphatase [Polyangiaceae bacterium]
MIELGLVVGIDVVGLMLALLMWRGVSVRDAGPAALRRLGSALERAARAFLWQEYRLIGIASFVLLLPMVVSSATIDVGAGPVSRVSVAFWGAAGLCLGALGSTIAGYVSTVIAVRGSVRTAAAAHTSIDAALGVAMRAAGSANLISETLSGLLVSSLFVLLFAIQGGFALPSEQAQPLARHVVLLLPGFALGAAVSALVLQRGGGAFHAAGGVGSDQAGERDAGLDHDDARNPAVVAELVGDHVGASATRGVDGFASASVANVAALMIGASLSSALRGDPLLLLTLPLVVRAFGVIASAFGVILVRGDETTSVSSALLRGYLSTTAISLSGLWGISYWLFGEHFLPIFASAALGLIAVLVAAHALLLRIGRRSSSLRDSNEALRIGGGALVSASLGGGLETSLVPVAIFGVAVALAASIGAHGGLSSGVELSVLMFTLAAVSASPFVSSVATLGSIADGARGVVNMSNADAESKRRSTRLDDASFLGGAIARRYSMFSGALSSLLIAWAIAARGSALVTKSSEPPSLAVGSALAWCGALGAAVVLGYAGSVARAAVRGAREVSAEVERQLRGFPREHGIAQVPAEYTPSYKHCVELTTTVALRRALPPMAAGVLAPVLLGIGLRLAFGGTTRELVAQGLSWFVIVAALTGLTAALAVDAARATLGSVRRANRGRENSYAFSTSITADALSDIFGNAAAPALQLLVKATAAAALIITPFLL